MRHMPVRCTPVRCTPVRYTPMRCTPIRYTPVRCTPVRYIFYGGVMHKCLPPREFSPPYATVTGAQ